MRTSIFNSRRRTKEIFRCFNEWWRRISVLAASLSVLVSAPDGRMFAQPPDTSTVASGGEVHDPCSNRVFWMSTGAVSAPGRVSFGLMGAPYLIAVGIYQATVLQAGYAPTDFLQCNLSGSAAYWSAGLKARLLPPAGYFRGLAIGADFGFFPGTGGVIRSDDRLQAYNLAASFGTGSIEAHLNLLQLVQANDPRPTTFPTFVQFGIILSMPSGKNRHVSLLAELWMVNEYAEPGLKTATFIFGVRDYGQAFVFDGFLGGPRLLGNSGSESIRIFPLPYLGVMWFI